MEPELARLLQPGSRSDVSRPGRTICFQLVPLGRALSAWRHAVPHRAGERGLPALPMLLIALIVERVMKGLRFVALVRLFIKMAHKP